MSGAPRRWRPPVRQAALPTFAEAARVWAKIGFLSFGGPAGQIALMHRMLVEEKRWISESRFLHALNFCMLLPGPEAQQLATYIGWLLHGTRGGVVAGTLFVLPGLVVILTLSTLYAVFRQTDWLESLFFGLKAAVLVIVLEAVLRIGRRALRNRVAVGLAALAFIAIYAFHVPVPGDHPGCRADRLFRHKSRCRSLWRRRTCDHGRAGGNRRGGRSRSPPGGAEPRSRARRPCALGRTLGGTDPGVRHRRRLGEHLCAAGAVLQRHGGRHLWRGLCCPRLCRGRGRDRLWLARPRRDARRPCHGRDDARAAPHGPLLRRIPRRLPGCRRARARWRPA